MSKELKSWSDYKANLLEGLSEKQAAMVGTMMESTHKENLLDKDPHNTVLVNESTSVGSTTTGNITRYDTIFMPLIRRTMPALLAMDLVGVQPMSTPRGIVRTLRMRYSETTNDTSGGTPVVTAGTEASGQVVYEKYSKLALNGDYDDVDALDPFEQTEYLEGNRGKPMDLEVLTQSVEPMSRKLSAAYSLEAADDLQALDGLDIESELSQTLGDEILRELDRELLGELNGLAGTVEAFDFANVDGRYAGEKLAALTIALDNLSAQIAMKTRKAGATWMVVSQRVFTALKNASNTSFVPVNNFTATNGGDLRISSSLFVGMFGPNVRVYVDPYAVTDTVLMGYKGSDIDTGFVYSPYIPLQSSGVVRNPETGDFRVMLRTRYALTKFTSTATSLGDSPDYYARATIANLELGFTN
jgi:hypothetical protein